MDPLTATTTTKRGRNDLPEEESCTEVQLKRFRADDILLQILDGVEDDAIEDRSPESSGDLDSVVRSLEEEIGLSPPLAAGPSEPAAELGFLLEASDDELGLPPTSSPSVAEEEAAAAGSDVAGGGFWGFEGEISNCYDGFDLAFGCGVGGAEEEEVEGVLFQGGLFEDFGDVVPSASSDPWRQEEQPAL